MSTRAVPTSVRARAAGSLPQPRLAWAYFFDIDGTLVDIATAPDTVRIGAEMRAIIDRLHEATGGSVALVSGRSVEDIDRLYPGCRMPLSGQHGVELRDANGVHRLATLDGRLLDRARLSHSADERVANLAHGQQRQLEIGMALAGAPRLILFDEPAAGLSPAERQELVTLLRSLPAHMSFVLIEHDLDIALRVVERVTVMHNGRVLRTGSPDEIENDAQVQAIYMGSKH